MSADACQVLELTGERGVAFIGDGLRKMHRINKVLFSYCNTHESQLCTTWRKDSLC